MQFQYNGDYPGLTANTVGQTIPPGALAEISRNPMEFPPAQPVPCARITTRIFRPNQNQVSTVQNVLVRTAAAGGGAAGGGDGGASFSGSESEDDMSDDDDTDDSMNLEPASSIVGGAGLLLPSGMRAGDAGAADDVMNQHAYWIQRTIREAIYGRVLFAVVLKRRPQHLIAQDGAEWEVTSDHCAVKEMSWQHIRKERDRLAEDPIKEVSSMQYLKKWFEKTQRQQQQQQQQSSSANTMGVAESFFAMRETNIMMPLDLLSDERNLYSVMPYCDGGELFERLDLNERFSEDEARYWMDQVLNGIENLQHVGICHRDMSLENLLVHKDGALIIDMGMCLLVPYQEGIIANGGTTPTTPPTIVPISAGGSSQSTSTISSDGVSASGRSRARYLIRPQGTCGKWIYMSPEIYQNSDPFDAYAVDMWAAGVILFLMLTGFPPWERACPTDERFHYMTAGYLVQMLTEWEIGLTSDAMDLLQRMLFLDPKDRLSLDQVRAHPWMVNGQRAHPLGLER